MLTQSKFSVQPFSKGWQGGGAAPLLALRRGRNTPNDTEKIRKVRQPGGLSDRGEPYQGVPRRTKSCTAFPPNKNRASESKRCSLSRWRGFFLRKWALQGCALQGNPLIGFPHEKTSHRDVFSPRPDLFLSSEISPSAEGEEGALPLPSLPAF